VKNYSGQRIYRIACGADSFNYNWTEVLMSQAARQINGLSLHYYTVLRGNWQDKGSATKFEEADWHNTMFQATKMEELVTKHGAIMDKADPQKRVGMIVDEWGTWHNVEPGTQGGFLYQQNSLRDALVAGLTLNIFNQHCDRVKMANIAQTINVLQAMILTAKEKMLVTPTYHVFEMYTVHHDATLLPTELTCADYAMGSDKVPGLSVSASRDKAGAIHVSVCNLNPNAAAEVTCDLQGAKPQSVSGRVLTADAMQGHNTFDKPETVKPAAFTDCKLTEGGFTAKLPAKSVVVLELK